jgi:exopolysaccharide biosynthesis protein
MNFDGGGSTTMVVQDAVVNAPTDPSGEREVGNAVLLVHRNTRPKGKPE